MDDTVIIYGASWCPDCRRAKRFLGDQRIAYEWHDIEVDPDGVETLQAVSVTSITDEGHRELDVETSTGDHYHAWAVLLATGSSYRRTGVPGEEDLIGAGIHFCATCDGPFYKGSKQLMILGGGNSGLAEGLFLTQFTDLVTVVEYNEELRANKLLVDKVQMHPKMEVLTSHAVKEFRAKDDGSGKLGSVLVDDRRSGEIKEMHPAGCFVFIGLDPNTEFLKGTVDLDDRAFVVTNDTFMTSMPG